MHLGKPFFSTEAQTLPLRRFLLCLISVTLIVGIFLVGLVAYYLEHKVEHREAQIRFQQSYRILQLDISNTLSRIQQQLYSWASEPLRGLAFYAEQPEQAEDALRDLLLTSAMDEVDFAFFVSRESEQVTGVNTDPLTVVSKDWHNSVAVVKAAGIPKGLWTIFNVPYAQHDQHLLMAKQPIYDPISNLPIADIYVGVWLTGNKRMFQRLQQASITAVAVAYLQDLVVASVAEESEYYPILQAGAMHEEHTWRRAGDYSMFQQALSLEKQALPLRLVMLFDETPQVALQKQFLQIGILAILVIVVLAWVLANRMTQLIINPWRSLVHYAEDVVQGYAPAPLAASRIQEFERLAQAIVQLLARLKQQEDSLTKDNHRLQERVERSHAELLEMNYNLSTTQKQLIETEKLAALSELVVGVASEINTPVGVGMTAASHLHQEIQQFWEAFQAGEITRSQFEAYHSNLLQSVHLLQNTMSQAAELSNALRQVALSQTYEESRRIELKGYIASVIEDIKQEVHQSLRFSIRGDDGIHITTYPGAIYQLFKNLIMHTQIHQPEHSRLDVAISILPLPNGRVEVVYQEGTPLGAKGDDSHAPASGSQLGLQIVQNIATRKLGGQLACEKSDSYGLRFVLLLPLTPDIT